MGRPVAQWETESAAQQCTYDDIGRWDDHTIRLARRHSVTKQCGVQARTATAAPAAATATAHLADSPDSASLCITCNVQTDVNVISQRGPRPIALQRNIRTSERERETVRLWCQWISYYQIETATLRRQQATNKCYRSASNQHKSSISNHATQTTASGSVLHLSTVGGFDARGMQSDRMNSDKCELV